MKFMLPRFFLSTAVCAFFITPGLAATQTADQSKAVTSGPEKITLANNTEKTSYAIGFDIGHNFKQQNIPLDTEKMAQGLKDGVTNAQPPLTSKEMQTTLMDFQKELLAKRQAQMLQLSQKNLSDGQVFLENNKKQPGVTVLPNGLQYKIITTGKGESPTDQSTVIVHYEGSLINGQVFDSSYARKQPLTLAISNVIPGWSQALKKMKPGDVWMVYIPPALAYGEKGAGPIGPNQTLIFKIELLSTQPSSTDNASPKK